MNDAARDWRSILAEHRAVTDEMASCGEKLAQIVDALTACIRGGNTVYVIGNGGSAADAQHIAGELLGRFRLTRKALPAIALTTDSSTITAISNDLGYEQAFARQIEGVARAGDVVWLLSTSGNSPNVLAAARAAAKNGALVVGFTGRGGGELAAHCDLVFHAPHTSSDRIQEAHQIAYHYICEQVEAALA